MVVTDYLELIEQGVDAWNQWRSEHPDDLPDLESAYLFEKSLPGINLRGANLSRACLIGTNLAGADLTDANLSGIYASNANFQDANLAGADIRDGNLIEANLARANLADVAIENANFTNACLEGTCLDGWPEVAAPPEEVRSRQPEPAVHIKSESKTKPLAQLPVLLGAVAIAATILYIALRPKPPKFVTPDGTVTIQLVCDEPELASQAGEPDHTYQNGTRFYGDFDQGKPANGRGSMLFDNGNRYDGEYRDGKRNGCGTFDFANGRRYIGEFSDDLFSGRGVWMLENGDRYIGDFEFNRCNGEGVYIFADGTSQSGIWQQGRLVDGDLTCDRGPVDLPES